MMIEFRNVKKCFGSTQVLSDLSLGISRGEIVFLIGRSGVGKSVCLKLLIGLLPFDSGEIFFDGKSVSDLDDSDWRDLRRRCSLILQQPALIDSMTTGENILLGIRAHKLAHGKQAEEELVAKALFEVGLDRSILQSNPQNLSGSTRKRVSIARALVLGSECLLFDEPTTGLDPISTSRINTLIASLGGAGRTVVVVSHDMQCALKIADRILLLDDGRIATEGEPTNIRQNPHPLLSSFMEEADARQMA